MQQRATAEQTLNLRFEVFGWRALGERVRMERKPIEQILGDACDLLVTLMASNRPPPAAPRFKSRPGAGQDLTLALAEHVWDSIGEESVRSGLSLEQVVEHAAFVYLRATDAPGLGLRGSAV